MDEKVAKEHQSGAQVSLGKIVATPAAIEAMQKAGQGAESLIARHRSGDWGDVNADDAAANNRAVNERERVLSSYTLSDGTRVWIITEADRSVTTVLLPEDY